MKADSIHRARTPLLPEVRGVFHNRLAHLPETIGLIKAEPNKLAQTRHRSLERDYAALGAYFYGLGYPRLLVCQAMAYCSLAARKVFQLYGTEEYLPVVDVTIKADASAERKPRYASGTKDFSLTNSAHNIRAVAISLCAGRFDLARDISSMAWDPPNASYLSDAPGSYCTRNDQRLAYALREYFAGKLDDALNLLRQVRALPNQRDVWTKANMIRALVECDADRFRDAVEQYLEWFEKQATKQDNCYDPKYFLSTMPLGLSVLAVHEAVITPEQLPPNNPRLSLELLRLALQDPCANVNELAIIELDV